MIWPSQRNLEHSAPKWSDKVVRLVRPDKNPFTENNRKTGTIFIHIPKNAGRSIYSAVLNEPGRHIPLRRYYMYDAQAADACFKFAVVRHPVDRFVSAFDGLKGSARGADGYSKFVRKRIDHFSSVDEFGAWMANSRAATAQVLSWLHFWPQYKWISVGAAGVRLDEILHFESLADDWSEFAERHSFPSELPRIGKSAKPRHMVNSRLDAFLRMIYKADFEIFGYKK